MGSSQQWKASLAFSLLLKRGGLRLEVVLEKPPIWHFQQIHEQPQVLQCIPSQQSWHHTFPLQTHHSTRL